MSEILVYPTHIEVFPYVKGENFQLEKSLSTWDPRRRHYDPLAYKIDKKVLYLPRGVNVSMLEMEFNATATNVLEPDKYSKMKREYKILWDPKNRIQEESIQFLLSEEQFYKGNYCNQFGLNLDTGDGKTYTMLNAIIQMNNKAIVITHKTMIKNQWISTIQEMSDVTEDDIYNIDSSKAIDALMGMDGTPTFDIYFVNHQTLESYAKTNGWDALHDFFKKIEVGVKVFDEAHLFFSNIVMIDMFSNINRTYYLTATFGRSDNREANIYKTAFSNVMRFGEETFDYKEKRKHIVLIAVKYRSRPTTNIDAALETAHGFSAYKYIDYALSEENHTLERVYARILSRCEKISGRILTLVPKIAATETVAELTRQYTDRDVYTIHSQHNEEDNEWIKENGDVIVSTQQSIGVGDDIKKLRNLICLTPLGSKVLSDQVRGRLREFDSERDTYFWYPVDVSISKLNIFYKRMLPMMRHKCKEIIEIEMYDL